MPTLTSGDTLSLNNLAGAFGATQNSNVSLGTKYNSIATAGANISMSSHAIDSVGSITGYTYLVENTTDSYTLTFSGAGSQFSSGIASKDHNFTWGISPSFNSAPNSSGYIQLRTGGSHSQNATHDVLVGHMNPGSSDSNNGSTGQNTLSATVAHTISVTFADGFNDHIGSSNGYNVEKTKTIYSVDTYDGNTALCLTSDTPVTKADGSIVEVGELEEGDVLSGYALGGLSQDEYSEDFYEWSTDSLEATAKDVRVVNVVYSFAQSYYSINDGDLTATGEHPFLVKDVVSGDYRFKETIQIENGDKLIKQGLSGIEEIEVTSKEVITETTEIVSIDVEEQDTYLANGYITHNKGSNSAHTDLAASSAPTGLSYSSPSISWTAPSSTGDTGITAYDFQISTASNFSSYEANVTEWSTTTSEVIVGYSLSPGTTYYLRVRAIDHGLKSDWSSTLTFTA